MQRIFSRFLLVGVTLALVACGKPPAASSYLNRGGPESLIDVSSEVVNLSVNSPSELRELSEWIENDTPTRAELNCLAGDTHCIQAEKVLDLHGVPAVAGTAGDRSVTLVYERILARDCQAAYVNNSPNDYNTNHPSFGCAVAANMVQHVTDKQEFVSPNLADDPSASRAVNDVRRAYTPRAVTAPYHIDDSIVAKAKTK